MENRFEITPEIMENAETYMPIVLKERIAHELAEACATEKFRSEEEQVYGLPPVCCESTLNKSRVLLTILLVFYLKVWDESKEMPCSVEDYDKFMSSHPINQIERFKGTAYREKAFDLLADFRDMEKRLNAATYAYVRAKNDPATRLLVALGEIGSAEGIQKAIDIIHDSQDGIAEEIKRQERIINGEEGDDADGE